MPLKLNRRVPFLFTDHPELVRVKWDRQFTAYDNEELKLGNILDHLEGRRLSGNLDS